MPHSRRALIKASGITAVGLGLSGCIGDSDTDDGDHGEPVEDIELSVTTADFDPLRHEMALLTSAQWEELGFTVDIETYSLAAFIDKILPPSEIHAAVDLWTGGVERIDPHQWLTNLYHSSHSGGGSGFNYTQYENPEYDQLADAQRATLDVEARRELVFECQEIIAEDQPATIICHPTMVMPYNSDRWSNPVVSVGEGLRSFWNLLEIEPAAGVTEFRYGYPADAERLNPLEQGTATGRRLMRQLFDPLMRQDAEGEPIPWAAEEVEIVDDETISVTLRDGMTFHDGEPVTIDDVYFSYNYHVEHNATFADLIEGVDNMSIEGEDGIVFELDQPDAVFLFGGMTQTPIIPQHIWENVPDEADVDEPIDWRDEQARIGSGPFKFLEWRRGEVLRFEAFEDHFQPPTYEVFSYVPGSDTGALSRALEQGNIDMLARTPSVDAIPQLEAHDHITMTTTENTGFYQVGYNTQVAPFDDRAVRRALAYAVPKQEIVDTLLDGHGIVSHSPITSALPWNNPDVKQFNLDLDAARDELSNAGYTWDDDGQIHYPVEPED